MYKLHTLSDKLMAELKGYADKNTYSANDIETIRNLISSVNKICEYTDTMKDKEEYSNRMSYDGSYNSYDGESYARGRRGNVRRDSMGRYSREYGYSRNDITDKLYEVMQEAPDHLKHQLQNMINEMGK